MRPLQRVHALMLLVGLLALAAPADADAHAVLEGTSPARGARLQQAPARVEFRFSEAVEIAFGAVRVYNQRGERIDRGSAKHPDGRSDAVAVGLEPGLGEGTYTATYRVISADSHPVSGGYVFSVGQGGRPAQSLDQLIDAGGSGPITEAGFGVVRGLSYLALATGVGAIVFVAAVWRPALRHAGGVSAASLRADDAFARRARRLTFAAISVGVGASALGIVFQGAVATGTSFWHALNPSVVGDVLDTRFGTVWCLRLLAWLALAGLLALAPVWLRVTPGRPSALGAAGLATGATASMAARTALTAVLGFLCLTPALGGHASTTGPSWLLVPANFGHVACMAVWVGGIATLVLALPAATRRSDPPNRTRLLAAAVGRFSTVAFVAVAGLIVAGTVQAIAELDAFSDLSGTAFGRAILIKSALLSMLLGFGAWNRQRGRPQLDARAVAGQGPGRPGIALRRSLRSELALMIVVLGVTAALVAYAPASGIAGPFSVDTNLGPARLELTVDPAEAGRNEVHIYLFDRRTGRRYERVKELTVAARLAERSIGPLPLEPLQAGPGHYLIRRAHIAPAGDWQLNLTARVSTYDAHTTRIEVPIR